MTSKATRNATSSPASAGGPTPCASPDGPTNALCGPAPVPVSRFRARDSEKAMPINATSGPLFTNSSPSAALQLSLENRLRARLDVNGSPEYALTWKIWDMPSGPPICALRASARRISANGFSGLLKGWTTPQAHDVTGRSRGQKAKHGTKHGCACLARDADLAGWATPTARDHSRGGKPPRPQDTGVPLSQQTALAGWATPTARDTRSEHGTAKFMARRQARPEGKPLSKQVIGTNLISSPAPMQKSGALNPAHSRWLMGYPTEWDASAPTATRSTRTSRPSL